ncbi:MAG: mechanosensitive ion channel family protein [Acidobacteriota bacterium]|nr:mechanosensitive ion channel family protein [Acidobacteriota bacterium]MDQ7087976.1 mechanosensitive ion channel family protein [Acidobacteriota bacterium]
MESLEFPGSGLMPLLTTYGVRVVGVVVLLIVGWIVAGWSGRVVSRGMARAEVDITLTRFTGKLIRWLVMLLVVLAGLGLFGVETTSFAAVLAATGFAVGMAFQGTLGNFASGVMLLVFRPFKVGDVVSVAGVTGSVHEIGIFTVSLDTPDNRRLVLPNGAVFGATIENITFHDSRRVDVNVGADYGADIDRTRAVLLAAAEKVPGVDRSRPIQVVLTDLGASSVDWSVRVWCKTPEYWAVRDALVRAVKMALDEASIAIPYPQLDVHLDPSARA